MAFSLIKRAHSFRHAFRGIKLLVLSQHNVWIHAIATIVVVVLGWSLRIKKEDWLWITAAVALVWIAEALNTSVEMLADEVSQEHRVRIGQAKDLGAASVLIAAIAALAISIMVFTPYIFHA